MINNLQPPKGFRDLFDRHLIQKHFIIDECNRFALLAKFSYVELPHVEAISTFQKANTNIPFGTQAEFFYVQNKSAAVTKKNLVLRPELTSGLLRAYLNRPEICQKPQILFTNGPCFRYESPQKGRFRQFWQWNLEQVRVQNHNLKAVLAFLARILERFALIEHVTLEINYLTSLKLAKLNKYLKTLSQQQQKQLCLNCQKRFQNQGNLYRILDCHNCGQQFRKEFTSKSFLNEIEYQQLMLYHNWLQTLLPNIKLIINPILVRGLNYYQGLVFEIKYRGSSNSVFELWSQNTIIAGGQYQLSSFFQNKLTTNSVGFGFAIGIERLLLVLQETGFFQQLTAQIEQQKVTYIGYLNDDHFHSAYQLQTSIHQQNYIAHVSEKNQHFPDLLNEALALKARYLIVFDDEFTKTKQVLFKILVTKGNKLRQYRILIKDVVNFINQDHVKP